jgi:hypothetical protein
VYEEIDKNTIIENFYAYLGDEVKRKINDKSYKCYKFEEVLWSVSKIIGRKVRGKMVAYKVV